MIHVLGTYVHDVKDGDNLTQSTQLMKTTLTLYVSSAHKVLEILQGRTIVIWDRHHGGKAKRFHRFIGDQLDERAKWSKPKPKKCPFTTEMFLWLRKEIQSTTPRLRAFLGLTHCVYDWTSLGVFTGSRIGEYGQSNVPTGQRFNVIPSSNDVPEAQRGMPIAFVASDFTFMDSHRRIIPPTQVLASFRARQIWAVKITFRYDKSPRNWVTRSFCWVDHPIFNPVRSAVCIIHRAHLLRVPAHEPLGVWSSDGTTYRFLKDREVTERMQTACLHAYPDPNHFMRANIKQVVTHSNRVTAAVCLQKGGATIQQIAFKLRWKPDSVEPYLRDCFDLVGGSLEQTIAGTAHLTYQ